MAAEEPIESQLLRKMPSTKFKEASAALSTSPVNSPVPSDISGPRDACMCVV